jgi:XisI protein
MANLIKYPEIVQQLLQDYAALSGNDTTVATELIFDTARNSYQLVHVGWHGDRRIYGCILHTPFPLKEYRKVIITK